MDNQLEFDIFLAHNNQDNLQARAIAGRLKQRNLKPWIDEEQILPGESFQKVIQKAIPLVKSAAILVGTSGLGNWQAEEVELLMDECKQADKPLFIVLLPGTTEIPQDLGFIKQRHWVSFDRGINQALNEIESGIRRKPVEPFFDVLLCYKEEDIPEVRQIESQLKAAELHLWQAGLSASTLQLSVLTQLDQHLARIWSIVVFVGSNGGLWEQDIIAEILIDFRLKYRRRSVIPVVLKSVVTKEELRLPVYLRGLGKVDFRQEDPPPMKRLLFGITREEKYQGSL